MKRFGISLFLVLLLTGTALAEEARLLRFPDVGTDLVAFVYAGDIYTAPRQGGQAIQLTSDPGLELFPKISPDGSKIAFTGQYDGVWAVYVMPITGGQPQRLTWHPGIPRASERFGTDYIVLGWSHDGRQVLFRSGREATDLWRGRVYRVGLDGGLPEALPMTEAGFTSLSPDGGKVAYCPIYRDFRTWKRYKGGMAQDVWIFDLTTFDSKKITDWVGTDNMPMWAGDQIYFNSDRTNTLNLFAYDTTSGLTRQVTKFDEWDVRWPSLGAGGVAFENAGYVYVMDLPGEELHKLSIQISGDRHRIRPELISVSDNIRDLDIAPNGKRVAFEARGDLFTVPAKEGNTRLLVTGSSSAISSPKWSPDGKWLAYLSDKTGEEQLYLTAHDGSSTIALTNDRIGPRHDLEWSPDSRMLAFTDLPGNLYYLDVESKVTSKVDSSDQAYLGAVAWSPDSRFIAYNKVLDNRMRTIFVYSLDDQSVHQVTAGLSNDYSPAWDANGKYLYFISERNFNPILSRYEFEFANQAIQNLYLVVLQADGESPFEPGDDEAVSEDSSAKPDEDDSAKGKDRKKSETPSVRIDWEGIFDREVAFDLPAGNYGWLSAADDAVFYISSPIRGMRGNVTHDERTLHKYSIEDRKDSEFAAGIRFYRIAADGKTMLVTKRGDYFLCSTRGKKADFDDGRVDVSNMKAEVDHAAEYVQMFNQVWRGERDGFYDPNMHGVDWQKIHDKYAVLLPYVSHRFDLTYIIGEMISELACSHTYTGGGEMPRPSGNDVGLLGVDFQIDRGANRIRIAKILEGENFDPDLRSPLLEPGVDARAGDYLLAIDGAEVTAAMNPYRMLQGTIGKEITLTVNGRPSMQGARTITVKPIRNEQELRYFDWVQHNLHYVDSVSHGQIGYLHIPDMDSYGLYRFTKMFYNQFLRPGLIIDVRWNGGGFVSGLILERLRRTVAAMGKGRYGKADRDPGGGILAYQVALQNQFSCSDGDIFPFMFQQYKLGPTMGMRSWGGVIGIEGFNRLVDGGYFTIPGFGMYDLDGNWVVENHGVEPDIELENLPGRLVEGYDDQLDAAIQHILKLQQEKPLTLPEVNGPPSPR